MDFLFNTSLSPIKNGNLSETETCLLFLLPFFCPPHLHVAAKMEAALIPQSLQGTLSWTLGRHTGAGSLCGPKLSPQVTQQLCGSLSSPQPQTKCCFIMPSLPCSFRHLNFCFKEGNVEVLTKNYVYIEKLLFLPPNLRGKCCINLF